jgi:hypothetical protein
VPVSKITLSTAMRARDVSRPRAEDLAEAAEGEDALAQPRAPAAGMVGMTATAGTTRTSGGKVPAERRTADGTAVSADGRTTDGTAKSGEGQAAQPADAVVPPIPVAPSRRHRRRNR